MDSVTLCKGPIVHMNRLWIKFVMKHIEKDNLAELHVSHFIQRLKISVFCTYHAYCLSLAKIVIIDTKFYCQPLKMSESGTVDSIQVRQNVYHKDLMWYRYTVRRTWIESMSSSRFRLHASWVVDNTIKYQISLIMRLAHIQTIGAI